MYRTLPNTKKIAVVSQAVSHCLCGGGRGATRPLQGKDLTIIANHFKSDHTGDAEGPEQERLLQASLAQRSAEAAKSTADSKMTGIHAGTLANGLPLTRKS